MQDQIKKLWNNAEGIVVLAGAGMGVDSGLPDFRGNTGLWTEAKSNFLKYSTAKAFDDDPVTAWNFYIERINQYGDVKPHRGFTDLLNLFKQHNKDYFVVTSNVDGHFQKAGYDPSLIHEIHGDLQHTQCINACKRSLHPMPTFEREIESLDEIPKCPTCNHVLRPHVLLFSDSWFLWQNVDRGLDRYNTWAIKKLNIIGIEIGAGTVVPSIRYFGEERTSALIRINLHESDVTRSQDLAIAAGAVDGIDIIVKSL